jgi:3-hydroxyisobutyrate dehydrogenase-like beta-hydroxyacid dehydrogenase
VLQAFSETIHHRGPVGAGHKAKLIHNFIAQGNAIVLAEAFCTAAKLADAVHRMFVLATTLGHRDKQSPSELMRPGHRSRLFCMNFGISHWVENEAVEAVYYQLTSRGEIPDACL